MDANKPILCLDFDGVIHSYESGWKGADVIPDPPVEGAMMFIADASRYFRIAIFSSRSNQPGGLEAMKEWLRAYFVRYWRSNPAFVLEDVYQAIEWPTEKPAAFLTIDDRALTFTGIWPTMADLLQFEPWNKRSENGCRS